MLRATPQIAIPEHELSESFMRASGPGGQNVNKVATAVQLRFDVERSPSLPQEVRARLARLAGRRLSADGVLVIEAKRYRSQERNREDARARLAALVERATLEPKPRKATRPPARAKVARLKAKRKRADTKQQRKTPPEDA